MVLTMADIVLAEGFPDPAPLCVHVVLDPLLEPLIGPLFGPLQGESPPESGASADSRAGPEESLPRFRSTAEALALLAAALILRARERCAVFAGLCRQRGIEITIRHLQGPGLLQQAEELVATTPLHARIGLFTRMLRTLALKNIEDVWLAFPLEQLSKHRSLNGRRNNAREDTGSTSVTHRRRTPALRPKQNRWARSLLPWILPVVFCAFLPIGIISAGSTATLSSILVWLAANAVLGVLSCVIVRGHPRTLAAAAILGPLSVFHPFLGSGMVCAWAEYSVRKPRWQDLADLSRDLRSFSQWFRNRTLRILLVWMAGSVANTAAHATGLFFAVYIFGSTTA